MSQQAKGVDRPFVFKARGLWRCIKWPLVHAKGATVREACADYERQVFIANAVWLPRKSQSSQNGAK